MKGQTDPAMSNSIKCVKPAYVQTLRPETSNVSDDDVRLSYAQLFFNTFNGFEKEDLGAKLRAFCVDDCSMSVKWIGERGACHKQQLISCSHSVTFIVFVVSQGTHVDQTTAK